MGRDGTLAARMPLIINEMGMINVHALRYRHSPHEITKGVAAPRIHHFLYLSISAWFPENTRT